MRLAALRRPGNSDQILMRTSTSSVRTDKTSIPLVAGLPNHERINKTSASLDFSMRLLSKFLCLLALAACAPLASAQIYHCVGAHGEPVYSGQPCGTPAQSATVAPGARNGLGGVCAKSPQALQQAITNAFAGHDVNQLAGLILWRGMDQASARATLHSLSEWLKQPLIGITVVYPTGPPFTVAVSTPPTSAADGRDGNSNGAAPIGFTVSTSNDTRDFGITESGGCWWLMF